jgi:hypothetical protein
MEGLLQRITPLANQVIFDFTLPAAALLSYLRLLALAGGSDFSNAGPLDFAGELLPLLGVQKNQARLHLRLLRMAKLLYWATDAEGRYTIYFLPFASPEAGNAESVDDVFPLTQERDEDSHQKNNTGRNSGKTAAG